MTELIALILMGLINFALLIVFFLAMRENREEKSKLINALVAKTPEQVRDLTLADKVRIIQPSKEKEPDLMNVEALSDEDFDKHIQSQLGL